MKILFTDLDGTLLNNNSIVSDTTRDYLIDFTSKGNKLVLASGRPLESILEVKNKAGLDFPGIFITSNNGALVYDCDSQKNILEIRLDMDQVEQVWDLAKESNIHIQTYTDNSIISIDNDKEIEFYTKRIHLPVIASDNAVELLSRPPFKLLAIDLDNQSRLQNFCDLIKNTVKGIDCIFSNTKYLEIFSEKAGKGTSLKWLCEYLNIDISDSIAAGDAANDLSMLIAAGSSIAMCNGDPELFRYATHVSKLNNHEDGLIHTLMEILN